MKKNKIRKAVGILALLIMCSMSIYSQNKNTILHEIPDSIKNSKGPLMLRNANFDSNGTVNIFSPQVELIRQFGSHPVDLSTGLVDITIPLYEIKTGELQIPIELKFHPSGLKATERESILGVRWLLSAGGCITRTIKGYPDENLPFKNINSPDYRPDFLTLFGATQYTDYHSSNSYFEKGIVNGKIIGGEYRDTEYDIFTYHLPNEESGHFIITDNNGVKEALTLPYRPYKFKFQQIGGFPYEITSASGIKYIFNTDREDTDSPINGGSSVTSVWYLSSIISPNKQDTISFKYAFKTMSSTSYEYYRIYDRYSSDYEILCDSIRLREVLSWRFPFMTYKSSDQLYDYMASGAHYVSEIKFRGGVVKFNYSKDILLESMEVYNQQNEIVRKYKFQIEKNKSGNILFLKTVSTVSPQNEIKDSYSFDYYDDGFYSAAPPISDGGLCEHTDRWGYFAWRNNGMTYDKIQNYNYQSTGSQYEIIKGSPSLDPDEESTKLGMIQSITYPTGGKTMFEYELNKYQDIRTEKMMDCGGLRIKKITNVLPDKKVETKTYEYEEEVIAPYIKPLDNVESRRNYYTENKLRFIYMHCCYWDPRSGKCLSQDLDLAEMSFRRYTGTVPGRYTEFAPLISYNKVTEKTENNGKTIYYYDKRPLPAVEQFPEDKTDSHYLTNNMHVVFTDFWKNNKLESKVYYKEGSDKPHKWVAYQYETRILKTIYDMYIFLYENVYNFNVVGPEENVRSEKVYFDYLSIKDYWCNPIVQTHEIGDDLLINESEVEIIGDQKIERKVTYSYDDNFLLLNKTAIKNSNENVITESITYPFNYVTSPYKEMVDQNMLSPVIKRTKFNEIGESIVTQNNYKKEVNMFLLDKISLGTTKGMDVRVIYHNYDKYGNPLYITKDDATHMVYLWSYGGQYPIAEIQNATYDEVSSILGKDFIEKLSKQMVLSDADKKKIDDLRSKLPSSSISTYTYQPLVGMLTATDPRGIITYYDYDAFGRLKETYIKENGVKKVVQAYDYHYRNQ